MHWRVPRRARALRRARLSLTLGERHVETDHGPQARVGLTIDPRSPAIVDGLVALGLGDRPPYACAPVAQHQPAAPEDGQPVDAREAGELRGMHSANPRRSQQPVTAARAEDSAADCAPSGRGDGLEWQGRQSIEDERFAHIPPRDDFLIADKLLLRCEECRPKIQEDVEDAGDIDSPSDG